jgi:hypothetical protein
MPYGPGKFEGEPASTFMLWFSSLDSGFDEDFSNEGFGWWAKFEGTLYPGQDSLDAAMSSGYTIAEIQEAREILNSMSGAILHEDDRGFVHADIWNQNGKQAIDTVWNDLLQEYAEGAAE